MTDRSRFLSVVLPVETVLANSVYCQQNPAMGSITIRNVPDEVRDELAARARRSGRSLQEFLVAELAELSRRPDPSTLVAQMQLRKEQTGSRLPAAKILEHRDHDRR